MPYVVVAADFQQLNPVGGGVVMQTWVNDPSIFQKLELETVFRTNDAELLTFLSAVRERQPPKAVISEFFRGRVWRGSLSRAVGMGLQMMESSGSLFAWLCVTNEGADKVNAAALKRLGMHPGDVSCDLLPV